MPWLDFILLVVIAGGSLLFLGIYVSWMGAVTDRLARIEYAVLTILDDLHPGEEIKKGDA